MGFQVPANTNTWKVGEAKYCIAVFQEGTPFGGVMTHCGLFLERPDGWNNCTSFVADYTNPNDLINDVQAKGGIVKFLEWIKEQFAAMLTKFFSTPVVVGEPLTDEQAIILIQQAMHQWVITVDNGRPKLQ